MAGWGKMKPPEAAALGRLTDLKYALQEALEEALPYAGRKSFASVLDELERTFEESKKTFNAGKTGKFTSPPESQIIGESEIRQQRYADWKRFGADKRKLILRANLDNIGEDIATRDDEGLPTLYVTRRTIYDIVLGNDHFIRNMDLIYALRKHGFPVTKPHAKQRMTNRLHAESRNNGYLIKVKGLQSGYTIDEKYIIRIKTVYDLEQFDYSQPSATDKSPSDPGDA